MSSASQTSDSTWGDVLKEITVQLSDAGIDSAANDAMELLLAATKMSRTDFFFARTEPAANHSARARLSEFASRRAAREPLQHIVGTAPMMGLEFAVGDGVFVPRPETELLAQWAIERLGELADDVAPKVVDLCTGSGALALSIADAVSQADVIGVEIDEKALSWAHRNVARLQRTWQQHRKVDLVHGDATVADTLLPQWLGAVDVLVSNPPYVPLNAEVSPEVLADPHHAVFGGNDGLDVIRPMIGVMSNLLRDGGWCGVEHDDDSGADVVKLFEASGNFDSIEVHPDLAGRDRFTTARRIARGSSSGAKCSDNI